MVKQDEPLAATPWEEVDNLELWKRVCTTDPKFTRKVNQRGGFTAIGAQYQMRMATEEFGPYGMGWSVHDLQWGEIRNAAGELIEVTLDAEFWYRPRIAFDEPSDDGRGAFMLSVCMPYKVGNDTRKKLLTDLTTKALSKLGFNADVFLGLFDDNKYVESLGGKEPAPQQQQQAPPAQQQEQEAPRVEAAVVRQKRSAAMKNAEWGGSWLQDELKFGKFKGKTWEYLTMGQYGGDRMGWLDYMSAQDPTTDRSGNPVPENYLMGNLTTQERCRTCLQQYHLQHDGAEEVPF